MADPLAGDRPLESANGPVDGQQERIVDAIGAAPTDAQTLADGEQILADTDQTLADADQTAADDDQTNADQDQVAADIDQAASDRDLGHGVDSRAHEFSRDIRERTTRQREQTSTGRLDIAARRDAGAAERDVLATARDQAAAARDLAAARRDRTHENDPGSPAVASLEIVRRAGDQRARAAQHRADAAEHRAMAADDRQAALDDRAGAARDRLQALADRQALIRQLEVAETDPLTGARTRSAGLTDLDHEIERCRRNGSSLVVVYVDVVGLKAVNDSAGHLAGDELIKRIVACVRSHIRSYDLIVRVGGDEFVCALSNATLAAARERFRQVENALTTAALGDAIRTGLAEHDGQESATDLIARADDELLARRG